MKRIFHKAYLLSAVMLLLLLVAPITALADGGEDELTQTVDGYQVKLVIEKPITSGENQFHIQVSNAQGQPVTNAQVEVSVVEAEAEHTEAEEPTPQSAMSGMGGMSEEDATPTPQSGMQSMGDMSEVKATPAPADDHGQMVMVAFTAGHEAGEYEGEIVVAGSGDWTIRVHLTVEDHLIEYDFPLHTASAQTTGKNILLGFFTINGVILATAFTLKLKSAAV